MTRTSRREFLAATSALTASAAVGLSGSSAFAQQYPAQDIHFICAFPPGSGADVIVRYFAEKVRPLTGKNIIVENRVGAGGNIALEYVARAKPDGYTIFVHGGNAVAASMSLYKKPPVDVAKAYQMAATINRQPFMLVVDEKSPYKTTAELTKAMLAKGEKASYATSAPDGTVMGEIYKSVTGVKALEVSYKTASDSINDMASGSLDYAMHNPVFALAQQREGRMRILGVSTAKRLESNPDLPTMGEQGIPMDLTGWWAAMVPTGTPRPAIDALHKWFSEVVAQADTKKFLNNLGGDQFSITPDEAQALFLKDIENWKDYVRVAKLQPQG